MTPVCVLTDTYCTLWAIQEDYLYQRVFALTNSSKGWAGIMWGATDGMAGGQSTILSVPTAYGAIAEEMYNYRKGKPASLPNQTIPTSNVTGMSFTTNTGLDVSFVRALAPMGLNHTAIPSKAGVKTNVSMAYSDTYFSFHQKNAIMVSIDIAGSAAATAVPSTVAAKDQRVGVADILAKKHGRHAINQIRK